MDSDPDPDPSNPATFPATDSGDASRGLPRGSDAGATDFLAKFLTLTPFLDLHERALKVSGGEHAKRGGICFFSDFLVRTVVVVLILGLVVFVAWKALAPLPDLFVPKN